MEQTEIIKRILDIDKERRRLKEEFEIKEELLFDEALELVKRLRTIRVQEG